jgi:hypothetical protein
MKNIHKVATHFGVDVAQVVDARAVGNEVVVLIDYGIGGIKKYRLPLDWLQPAPGPAAEVTPEPEPAATPPDDYGEQEFEALTVAELQELAKERGIAYSGLRKAELIEALEAGEDD